MLEMQLGRPGDRKRPRGQSHGRSHPRDMEILPKRNDLWNPVDLLRAIERQSLNPWPETSIRHAESFFVQEGSRLEE